MEELETKLRKATKQEELLLKKAEDEAEKRRELMDDLENGFGKSDTMMGNTMDKLNKLMK